MQYIAFGIAKDSPKTRKTRPPHSASSNGHSFVRPSRHANPSLIEAVWGEGSEGGLCNHAGPVVHVVGHGCTAGWVRDLHANALEMTSLDSTEAGHAMGAQTPGHHLELVAGPSLGEGLGPA